MTADKKSIYECPVDKQHTIKAAPGQRMVCRYCYVEMKEIKKGIIRKFK